MPLPLDDKNNPLYGLSKEAQCQVFVQWQQKRLTPYQLLSLPKQYNQDQITKAYRQLALLFHPDRNPGNKLAEEAFKILSSAYEYLEYGLKSDLERRNARDKIVNNSFYKVYAEEGWRRTGSTPTSSFSSCNSFQYRSPSSFSTSANYDSFKQDKYRLSFEMIIQKAENKYIWNCRPWLLPDSLIAALKRHIEVDKSLLRKNINYRPLYLERVNITHVVAYHGNSHFLKWLIKVGANPTIRAKNYHHEAAHDVIQLMAEKGDVNFLRYLLKRFGAQLFYNKDKSGVMRPQWWRFEGIISHKKMQVALFLIDEVGYGKHLDSQPFDSFSNSIPLIKRILFSHAHIDDFNYFDYFDSSQRNTGEAEKKALKMLNLLLNQENISSDKLYFGIQTLLCVIEKPSLMHIDWKYYNYATRNLLIQLIDRIHIQPGELKKISSVARQKMKSTNFNNPRAACIWAIYCTTLNHGKNEILQKLQAASGLPIPHYDVRNNILKHVFFGRGESYPSDVIRKAAKHDDLDTLLFLIDLDRFGSLQTTYEFKTGRTKFEGYTPLHLACEDGRQDLALQLIKKMKAKGGSFDAIAHSNEEGTCYASYYSSLHLAIEEGITQVAVSLIEAGADIHLKGIRYKPSGFCSIFAECQEETALQMAIRKRQPQVIRSLQRAMLKDYIKQREEESEYLSQVSLFGFVLFSLGSINLCGLVLGFGNHSKTAKLQKAYEFRELLSRGELNEDALENFNDDVSQEGRLGQIIQLSHHYLTRSISLNNPLRI